MPSLILQMQSSIDGYVNSRVEGSHWQLWDWGAQWPWSADVRGHFQETFDRIAGILLSPVMLDEGYLDHWSTMAQTHPGHPDWRFAERIGSLPIYVPTRSPRPPAEAVRRQVRVLAGPLEQSVAAALEDAGGDLGCFGGTGLARSLLQADLVDEIQLFVNPGISGDGDKIFSSTVATTPFVARESLASECGIAVVRLTRER